MLAIDKSVNALGSGNDIEMSDFIKNYGEYDPDMYVSTFRFSNPRECNREDKYLLTLSKFLYPRHPSKTEVTTPSNEFIQEKFTSKFPETWLHETINMNNKDTRKLNLTLPDSVTTWDFKSISLNKFGITLAEQKQLVVKQDFFMKIVVPYSTLVDEILDIDVIVFDFRDNNSSVVVTLSIDQKGFIVERVAECSYLQQNYKGYSKIVMIKDNQGTKVNFNVQAKEIGNLKLTLSAISFDQTKKSSLERSIEVVNYGVRRKINDEQYNCSSVTVNKPEQFK